MIAESTTPMTTPAASTEIRRGFLAMVPLWAGVSPFAMTFGILARTAGFTALETQALSMLVFAGSAQIRDRDPLRGRRGRGRDRRDGPGAEPAPHPL